MKKKSKTELSESKGFRVLEEGEPKRVSRGEDMYGYGEQKKPLTLSMTGTAKNILSKAAKRKNLSRSEFTERWLRNEVAQTLD